MLKHYQCTDCETGCNIFLNDNKDDPYTQQKPNPACLYYGEDVEWKEIPIPECTEISVDIHSYLSTLAIESEFLINQILYPEGE